MLVELKGELANLLPLQENEQKFIDLIRKRGQIEPRLITNDPKLQAVIQSHPAILRAARRKEIEF